MMTTTMMTIMMMMMMMIIPPAAIVMVPVGSVEIFMLVELVEESGRLGVVSPEGIHNYYNGYLLNLMTFFE